MIFPPRPVALLWPPRGAPRFAGEWRAKLSITSPVAGFTDEILLLRLLSNEPILRSITGRALQAKSVYHILLDNGKYSIYILRKANPNGGARRRIMSSNTDTRTSIDPLRVVDNAVYYDGDIYEQEINRVLGRSWQIVCHESESGQIGDFYYVRLPGWPIVIVRGTDNVVRAFFNTCRHRGALVVGDACGHASSLRCPYHFWVYSLNGDLIGVPGDEAYEGSGFSKDQFGLVPLHCEVRLGLVFVNPAEGEVMTVDESAGAGSHRDVVDAACERKILRFEDAEFRATGELEDLGRECTRRLSRSVRSPILSQSQPARRLSSRCERACDPTSRYVARRYGSRSLFRDS